MSTPPPPSGPPHPQSPTAAPSPASGPLRPRRRLGPGGSWPTLGELAERLGATLDPNDAATVLSGVTLDSRAVQPGDLYAALPGSRAHGADFCDAARAAGAAAVLTDPAGADRTAGLPTLVVPDPRGRLGEVAAWLYGEPATQLRTIGVTGTNGKTTTSYLAEAALRAVGQRTGLVGTVEVRLLSPEGVRRLPSARTTPEAPDLQALLAVMAEAGTDAVAMEVSSHALVLGRVDGLVVDVAVFTNLSQDHLDFHPDMESYFQAKASLFTPARSRRGVVCVDDEWGRRLAEQASVPVVTVATASAGSLDADADVDADVVVEPTGPSRAAVRWRDGRSLEISLRLPGRFNLTNATLALVAVDLLGLDVVAAAQGVAEAVVPGRMEAVDRGQPFLAVVDFAHTPEAVRTALQTLREQVTGRLVTVLGCGGDRDAAKRPLMGEIGARESDVLIVTDDNPRSEDPAAIRAAVLEGARRAAGSAGQDSAAGSAGQDSAAGSAGQDTAAGSASVLEVAGRAAALRQAVALAGPGDVVAVLGKGHEQGQTVAGVVTPFDDRVELARALDERDPQPAGNDQEHDPNDAASRPEEAL